MSIKNFVPYGEIAYANALSQEDFASCHLIQSAVENFDQLIFLPPHEDAKFLDHGAQSPTFKKPIGDTILDYYERKGIYK